MNRLRGTRCALTALFVGSAGFVAGIGAAPPAGAAVTLVSSWNPANQGATLVSVAYDTATKQVYVYDASQPDIHRYSQSGTEILPTIPKPGAASNDIDLDFSEKTMKVGATNVPGNSLLLFNGDDGQRLRAANKTTGVEIPGANVVMAVASTVGGAQSMSTNQVFQVNWTADTISRVNPATGVVVGSFPVVPAGSPAFDVFYGDIDINGGNNHIYVVSSSQAVIRELTITGAFVQDINVAALGITGMSGIAFDQVSGEAYVSSTAGVVYRLKGFPPGCGGKSGTIFGTGAVFENVNGTAGNDVILGLGGVDQIDGLGGNDTICGGPGSDTLLGNSGNDILIPGPDSDVVNGGGDTDEVRFSGSVAVSADLANGVANGEGADNLIIGTVENMKGTGQADTLVGDGSPNRIDGANGNDNINGAGGNDTILGGNNDDVMNGGANTDSCDGGAHVVGDSASNCETVTNVP